MQDSSSNHLENTSADRTFIPVSPMSRFAAIAIALMGSFFIVAPAQAGSLTNITAVNVPGAQNSTTTPYAINNSGEIAGDYLDPSVGFRVFSLVAGTYSTVDPGPTIAVNGSSLASLNNSGQIVGFANTSTPPNFGYYYVGDDSSSLTAFPPSGTTLPSGVESFSGFNDHGAVAGQTALSGFVAQGNTITYINPPTAIAGDTYINGINNNGGVVGQFDPVVPANPLANQEAFLYQDGAYTILSPANAVFVEATGISDAGEVVGYFDEAPITGPLGIQVTPILGFTYDNGVYNEFSVPGEVETELFAINDSSQVVGYFSDEDGNASGFTALAVPEPSTWTMMLLGLGGLGLMLRRSSKHASMEKPVTA